LAFALHAVAGVVVKEAEGDLVERGLDRGDLRQDVDAVAVLLDHPSDAADLALDTGEAVAELILGGGVATAHDGTRAAGMWRSASIDLA
jgi:hypothetical protein